jgi:hypothetical protein
MDYDRVELPPLRTVKIEFKTVGKPPRRYFPTRDKREHAYFTAKIKVIYDFLQDELQCYYLCNYEHLRRLYIENHVGRAIILQTIGRMTRYASHSGRDVPLNKCYWRGVTRYSALSILDMARILISLNMERRLITYADELNFDIPATSADIFKVEVVQRQREIGVMLREFCGDIGRVIVIYCDWE